MILDVTIIFNNYLFGLLIIVYSIYKFATWTFTLEEKYGYPGPKPMPFFGNSIDFAKDTIGWDIKNRKNFGHIYPIYIMKKGMFVVSDEGMLKQILVKDAKSFIDRPIFRITAKLSRHGLIELKGQDWERVRTLVSPIFTSGKLKNMFSMIDKSVKEMIDNLSNTTYIQSKHDFGLLTMDVMAKTIFGIEINAYGKTVNPFIEHSQKLFKLKFSNRIYTIAELFHLTRLIEYLCPKGILSPKAITFLANIVDINIKARKNSNEEHHDFLALMLKAHNELDKELKYTENTDKISYSGLSGDEITAQAILFLLAGYETTSTLLTFCSYYLAVNPDMQNEIYQEILENVSDKTEITYDMLGDFNLLEQGLNECLRMCPPLTRISRECTKDTTLISSSGQKLLTKKGMYFIIPIYAIHHDERLWPEPDKFDIHRFDKEKRNRNQFSFIPFGMGPRMCVGMRFGLLEAKLTLAHLLLKYEIVPCDKTPKHLNIETFNLITTKEPIIVALRKR